MEENIIRKYYNEYLKEAFDLDRKNDQTNCYILGKTSNFNSNKCFINSQNRTIDFYQGIGDFCEGFAWVQKGPLYNFINERGELLSKEWFEKVEDFHNGFAYVGQNNLGNFIDKEGNLLFKEPQSLSPKSRFYPNGVAIITEYGDQMAIINKAGKKVIKDNFMKIYPFQGKNAVAIKKIANKKSTDIYDRFEYQFHIIDCDGNDLKTEYDSLQQVSEDIFVASKKNNKKKFLVNARGERIGNKEFDKYHYFCFTEGYLVIENDGISNLIGTDGNYLFKNWYPEVFPLKNGVCKVKMLDRRNEYDYIKRMYVEVEEERYGYLDLQGGLISHNWYKSVTSFIDGMAVVGDDTFKILYLDGTLSEETFSNIHEAFSYITKKQEENNEKDSSSNELHKIPGSTIKYEFQDGTPFKDTISGCFSNLSNGVLAFYYKGTLTFYNQSGEELVSLNNIDNLYNSYGFELTTLEETPRVKKVNSKKKFFHYVYEVDGRKFLLDYKPIADYGDIIICEYADYYYIFEKPTLTTRPLGKTSSITLESNYIIIDDKKYFISSLDFIDISDLTFTRRIDKKSSHTRILTFDEFKDKFKNSADLTTFNKEIAELKAAIEKEKQENLLKEAHQKREEEERLISEKKENLRNSLNNLSEILAECSKYIEELQLLVNSGDYKKITIPEELLLIQVGDHLEINPIFLTQGLLKFIDFSTISFKNVKVSGIDFSYTNVSINPQEVYKKDMSNGKYRGIDFNFCSFEGVNTLNADFTEAILDFSTNTETINRSL